MRIYGKSLLCYCAEISDHSLIVLLVENRADINQGDNDGRAPLHIATQQGHIEVVRYLFEMGTDVIQASISGYTASLAAS
ncbi:MAG: ankyrin repeat domain-containing protein [Pseudomonadota bacterium]|nr:ankyrin repeat domain-containing protein [Pseudomonadota bacterium]